MIHDVSMELVTSMGPMLNSVSAATEICGIGPRRKTKPKRPRATAPIIMRRLRLILLLPLRPPARFSDYAHQCFVAAVEGDCQPEKQPKDSEQGVRVQPAVEQHATDDSSDYAYRDIQADAQNFNGGRHPV